MLALRCLYELLAHSLLLTIGRIIVSRGRLLRDDLCILVLQLLLLLHGLRAELGGVHGRWRDHRDVFLGDEVWKVGPHESACGSDSTTCCSTFRFASRLRL